MCIVGLPLPRWVCMLPDCAKSCHVCSHQNSIGFSDHNLYCYRGKTERNQWLRCDFEVTGEKVNHDFSGKIKVGWRYYRSTDYKRTLGAGDWNKGILMCVLRRLSPKRFCLIQVADIYNTIFLKTLPHPSTLPRDTCFIMISNFKIINEKENKMDIRIMLSYINPFQVLM